jgi:ferritin-like metal-binding protein YciE
MNDTPPFKKLFSMKLSDIYDAENQIVVALPKMISVANNQDLVEGLQKHLEETQKHVERLERVSEMMGVEIDAKDSVSMRGIIASGEDLITQDLPKEVMDAGLIAAAQAVEHHEIVCYGTLTEWAKVMNEEEVVSILKETLSEEESTDEKLSALAEDEVNQAALDESASEE